MIMADLINVLYTYVFFLKKIWLKEPGAKSW